MARRKRTTQDTQSVGGVPMTTKHMKRRKPLNTDLLLDIQPLTDNQGKLFESYDEGKHIVAYGVAGTGKAQPLYSKILTPSGWTTVGQIKIGEYVLTPTGKKSKVCGIFPQGKKHIYEIIFHDGSKTRCCLEHLWEINAPSGWGRRKKGSKKVVNTQYIIDFLKEKEIRKSTTNISIDLIEPVNTENIDLPIDPYLIGCLIGDGCLTTGTPKFSTKDTQILDKLQEVMGENILIKSCTGNNYDYNFVDPLSRKNKFNSLTKVLKELRIHGKKSYEKIIPSIYLHSGTEQKLNLMKGLMDTDGTVDHKNGTVSFSTTSEILAKQVQEIIWSLGGICKITSKIPTYMYDGVKKIGKKCYNVWITVRNPKDLFTLQRKKDLCRETYDKLQYRRKIKTVNYVGEEEAQCIMIEDNKHLYITDDYIITHNTFIVLYNALKDVLNERTPYDKIYIIRSLVQTREIGFLPGNHEDKSALFEIPYKNMVKYMFQLPSEDEFEMLYGNLKSQGTISFWSSSFLRGTTFDNCILIVDEFQNMNGHENDSIITRVGENCKIMFCGDASQSDLVRQNERNGIHDFIKILQIMPSFDFIEFGIEDVCRSGLVKEYLIAKHSLNINI
jgi:phosphate starvation-inducible protein PhoH